MDFIKCSRKYIFVLIILGLTFSLINYYFSDFILFLDESVSNFVQDNLVNSGLTNFFKIITNIGDVYFFSAFILLFFLVFKNRIILFSMISNLINVYVYSVIFKNVYRRERPLFNLIEKPSDFSFPSGHTMCSVAFYGFVIYLVSKYIQNKVLRYFLYFLLVFIMIIIGFSRIYLNVHFTTDVIGGAILGSVCLLMIINYVKIRDII